MFEFLTDIFGSEIIAMIVSACLPLFLFILPFALIAVLLERKVSAHMQDRLGPMRVGYHGMLQTIADIIKLIQKEDIVANLTDKKLFNLAPVLVFAGSYAVFAAIPFSSQYIGSNADVGIFFIIAVSSLVVAGILMAGWSSNNKYSLLGAMRAAAQIISYEIPTALVVLSVVMLTGTLSLAEMSVQQTAYFWNWNIFGGAVEGFTQILLLPFMLVAFLILYISSLQK
jgi:NADH-quinone oxidoreductase subunit H